MGIITPANMSLDKQSVARDFSRAAVRYDSLAQLQRRTGEALLARLPESTPQVQLDLGCGTGLFIPALQQRFPGATTIGADLAPGMIAYARSHHPGVHWLLADAEDLPFADESFDLIFSNLMVQWCPSLDRFLAEARRVLRPGGVLLCSTLLDGTLQELAEAWRQVDPDGRHVNRFLPMDLWRKALERHFPDAGLTEDAICLPYPDPMDLLRELKGIGAGFKDGGRRRSAMAPARLQQLRRAYPRTAEGGVVATYQAGYIQAVKIPC